MKHIGMKAIETERLILLKCKEGLALHSKSISIHARIHVIAPQSLKGWGRVCFALSLPQMRGRYKLFGVSADNI